MAKVIGGRDGSRLLPEEYARVSELLAPKVPESLPPVDDTATSSGQDS
jgi:hypothetical protein